MLGSYFGGVSTVLLMMAGLTYFSMLVTQMESGDYDQIKNTVMTNPVGSEGGKNNLTLLDFKFYPILELYSLPQGIDIYKGDSKNEIVDIDKLYSYIVPTAIQRERNASSHIYHMQEMRPCNEMDFTLRGLQINQRL